MRNFENIKKKGEAFWANEAIDRCFLFVSSTEGAQKNFFETNDLKKQWTDFNFRYDGVIKSTSNIKYYAEGFYNTFVNFGPGILTACIGGDYEFALDTVWFDKYSIINDWDNAPNLKLNTTSDLWCYATEHTDKFCDKNSGDYLTSMTDIGGNFDVLAALRGTQELLYDLYDYPQKVMSAIKTIQPLWKKTYDHFYNILSTKQGGMTTWMPIWSSKRYYPLQCDFSAMISPDMFKDYVLEDLRDQAQYLDRSIYHLDGPNEIPHLPYLLSIKEINAIQWTSGAGNASISDECWFEMYRQIQKAGKGLVLLGVEPLKVENLIKNLSTKGLFIHTECEDDNLAVDIVKIAESYGVK